MKQLIDEIEEDLDALKIYPTSADFPDVLKRIKHIEFNLAKINDEYNILLKENEALKQITSKTIDSAIEKLKKLIE